VCLNNITKRQCVRQPRSYKDCRATDDDDDDDDSYLYASTCLPSYSQRLP
jgi:hypothetical protein